eukprot:3720394-Prymnesium_polylepis.2
MNVQISRTVYSARGRAPWPNAGRLAVRAPTWPEGCMNLGNVFPSVVPRTVRLPYLVNYLERN